ncbi:NUDIX hydrolase [Spirosoma montaniterrae]|uniref:NUDIX hydrolase n=1 Tax=Spirosoma montaniterrae TaxID=1178516 RepID=A0A1P9WVM7_9BACT|nr:NUDIX hydrolase [Spirosoma montaniterrae]AQG79413.1 NUDIX hydrolase [Spirosoma montaniterrae]
MHRLPLLTLLRQHTPADTHERAMTEATIAFVEKHPDCFERSLLIGHVTGSAFIVSPDYAQMLLIHHRKLDRWLQPGGHADGDPDVAAVALREAQEETGLTQLQFASQQIFDVDVHTIPARGDVPEHLHYDVRFLFVSNTREKFGFSTEIKNIRWFSLDEADFYTNDSAFSRIRSKIYAKL